MADSTRIADDPVSQLVGFYCDGNYTLTEAEVRAWFPDAVLVPISAVGTDAGIVGDCEPGCMSITQLIAWVQRRRAAGYDPTVYCNETYGWVPVRRAFQAAGVREPHYFVADYDGIAVVPAGAVAKQYENPPLTHGHFDRSVVLDYWPGVDDLLINVLVKLKQSGLRHAEDSNMALLAHPTVVDRFDSLHIGADGGVYRRWGTTNDLVSGGGGSEAWGGKFLPGTLSAAWYNDSANLRLVAQGVDASGVAWIREVDVSGKVVREWTALKWSPTLPLVVGLPVAAPVVSSPDDDSAYATKDYVQAALGNSTVKAHKHDIGPFETSEPV